MVPGSFEASKLSSEPGNAGRILRVTIGVATLFFVTYYQPMQLQSLIRSQTQPIAYDMDALVDDIENKKTKLIMSDPSQALSIEVQTSTEASFTRLRHAVGFNQTRLRYEPDYSLLLQLVLNESYVGLVRYEILLQLLSKMKDENCLAILMRQTYRALSRHCCVVVHTRIQNPHSTFHFACRNLQLV
jgi:hypothetical protein